MSKPNLFRVSEARRRGQTGRVAFNAGYMCQATGMHHEDCPGRSSTWAPGIRGPSWKEFDKHHKYKKAWGGKDVDSNFLWLYKACHKKIHNNEPKALRLGLLSKPPDSARLIGGNKEDDD